MKKFVALFLVLVLMVACSPVAQSRAVQLPPELVGIIGIIMMVAVTAGLKWLGDQIGADLSDRAAEIASAFSALVVLVLNYLIGLVPAAYDNLLSALFAFLVVFLGGIGFYSLFLRKKYSRLAVAAPKPVKTRTK